MKASNVILSVLGLGALYLLFKKGSSTTPGQWWNANPGGTTTDLGSATVYDNGPPPSNLPNLGAGMSKNDVWAAVSNRPYFESVYKSWKLIDKGMRGPFHAYVVSMPDVNQFMAFAVYMDPASSLGYNKIYQLNWYDGPYSDANYSNGIWMGTHNIWKAGYQDLNGVYSQPIINYWGAPPYPYNWPANALNDYSFPPI
jgi:hypothetical protein